MSNIRVVDSQETDEIIRVIEKRFRGNTEFYREMVNIFFDTTKDELEVIQEAVNNREMEKLKFSAHYIKGGAANLGADKISKIAQQLEFLDENNIPNEGHKLLQQLNSELKKFSEFIDNLI